MTMSHAEANRSLSTRSSIQLAQAGETTAGSEATTMVIAQRGPDQVGTPASTAQSR